MDKLFKIAVIPLLLCGCQTPKQSVELSQAKYLPPPELAKNDVVHLPSVASEEPEPGVEPPLPRRSSAAGLEPSRSLALVAYQPEAESLPINESSTSDLELLDFEGMALQNNPAVTQATATVQAARGNWLQVGLPPNFRLGYSGAEIGDEGSAGQQGGYVAQEFVRGDKLRLNRQVAAWEIQRWERELDAVRLRVLTDVRVGYYDVLIAQKRRELAAELFRISEKGASAADVLFRGEEVSEADPLRARVASDNARILLQNSINQHVATWRRFATVLGMPDLELQRIEGNVEPNDLIVSWEDELERVLSESPELAAAMARVESARWAVQRACAERIPNVDVQAGVQRNDSNGDTISSVQIELPIPIRNRNQGGIRQAQAEAVAAQRAADRLTLDLQARLATAFQQYESARNQVQQYSGDEGILANSQRTLDLIRKGYGAEEFGVLDLLTAQRTYFQTNLAYLDAQRQLSASVMEIRGLLLRGSLSR